MSTRRLSYDKARCVGNTSPLCQTCRRREPGNHAFQWHIAPVATVSGCVNYYPPAGQAKETK